MSTSTDKEGFFKFGANDTEKFRKRLELRLEYEKFKIMDEERFRNRFACKKIARSYQYPRLQTDVLISTAQSTEFSMLDLLQRLDKIQRDVNNLKKAKLISENLSIPASPDNETLTVLKECDGPDDLSSTAVLDAAVEPVENGEQTIAPLNRADNNATNENYIKNKQLFQSDSVQYLSINPLHNFEESLDARERMKQRQKEKYARDLQQQIQENHHKKEKIRQKECEEKLLEYENTINQHQDKPVIEIDPDYEPLKSKQHSYARGGNGIFGEPLTESQKQANRLYRAELLQQIAEKQQRDAKILDQKAVPERIGAIQTREEDNTSQASKANKHLEPTLVRSFALQPVRKQSACVQVALETRFPLAKPKPVKVMRKKKLAEPTNHVQKSEDLLSQIIQLKIELAAERMRFGREKSKEVIQVYDPRSTSFSITPSFSATNLNLPTKVTVPPSIKLIRPVPVRLNQSEYGQSRTPYDVASDMPAIVPRSPSVGSLNLRTINKRIRRRLEQFKINDDLYRNEEPIIQEFMARECSRGSQSLGYFEDK